MDVINLQPSKMRLLEGVCGEILQSPGYVKMDTLGRRQAQQICLLFISFCKLLQNILLYKCFLF